MTLRVAIMGAKGGVGTTTIATALAAYVSAQHDRFVHLTSTAGVMYDELHGICGLASAQRVEPSQVTGSLMLVPDSKIDGPFTVEADNIVNIADCGAIGDTGSYRWESADLRLLVTTACYLALRRAVHHNGQLPPHGVVLREQSGRAIGSNQVYDVLGIPIVATVPTLASISRPIDAGLLITRQPDQLRRAMTRVVAAFPSFVPARSES